MKIVKNNEILDKFTCRLDQFKFIVKGAQNERELLFHYNQTERTKNVERYYFKYVKEFTLEVNDILRNIYLHGVLHSGTKLEVLEGMICKL